MSNERIQHFLGAILNDERVSDRSGELVTATLVALESSTDEAADLVADGYLYPGPLAFTVEVSLDQMRDILSEDVDPNLKLLQWVRESCVAAATAVEGWSPLWEAYDPTPDEASLRAFVPRLRALAQQATTLLDTEALVNRVRQAVEETENARDAAQEAAGTTGASALATHFTDYAKGERVAANWFRAFTILAVVAGVLIAILFGPIHEGDWTALVFRVALVAGAGALAAYFGRQAGQHRRMYNWAKSLEVQLKSFPAFIQPLSDEERADAYRTFSRRVLAAPPEKGESSEDSVGAAQLLDIVAALAKRAQ